MNHRHGFNDRNLHLYRSVPSGFLGRSNGKLTPGLAGWTPYLQSSIAENAAVAKGFESGMKPALQLEKAIYKELANRYDICAATVEELEEIARVLYQHSEITLYDYAMLSFRPSAGNKSALGFAGKSLTKRERKNWIRHFEERVAQSQGSSNMSAYLHEKHLLVVLRKLYRKE